MHRARVGGPFKRADRLVGYEVISAPAGDAVCTTCCVELAQDVDHDVDVSRDDEHLHVRIDAHPPPRQLGKKHIPVVEPGDWCGERPERRERG
eukprot:scaffold89534_cov27-Tisochrysis_lutea.AAC.1